MTGIKKIIILILAAMGTVLIYIFQQGFYVKNTTEDMPVSIPHTPPLTNQPTPTIDPTSDPKVVSTNPSFDNQAVILPNQVIEITFNVRLSDSPELKNQIDEKTDYKVVLINDNKTAQFVPITPYEFGRGYTLILKSHTKFQNDKRLDRDYYFNFRTISYQGI